MNIGELSFHEFPDGEVNVTIQSDVKERTVIFVVNFRDPNLKVLPLILAAYTARALGAKYLLLLAPDPPYMRQDKAFEFGQGITSAYFAALLSTYVDALVTVDPHLHRWKKLSQIYTIPSFVVHSTQAIATWIRTHIDNPFMIGPDQRKRAVGQGDCFSSRSPLCHIRKIEKR